MVLQTWAASLKQWVTDFGFSEGYLKAAESQNLIGASKILLNHLLKDEISSVFSLIEVNISI